MNDRRRLALWATALALTFLAPGFAAVGQTPASAGTSEPPPESSEPDQTDDDPFGAPDVGEQVVHSFALSPAGADDAAGGNNRTNLSYVADPGTVLEDAVTLYNLGNEQLTFRVYATDALNADDGSLSILPGSVEPTDIGSWVTFPQENITVPPGRKITFPITITIPDDATSGDHTGAVLASSEALSTGESGGAVVLDRRTGTRLLVRVSGPLRPELAIEDLSSSYQHSINPLGGSARVTYRIQNRGNVRLSGVYSVSVTGPFGLAPKRAPAVEFAELLPGQDLEVTTVVEGVPALLAASATVRLEPGAGDGAALAPSSRSTTAFAPPITVLLALLALLFGVFARRAYRRHRGDGMPDYEVIPPMLEPKPERQRS